MTSADRLGSAGSIGPSFDVLLLDFGGVCLLNPVELHHVVEDHFGLSRGTLTWSGPLDPDADELYAQSIASGGISEREYWAIRAADVARLTGEDIDLPRYMQIAYDAPEQELIRPAAVEVVATARAAGIGVSVLTNDLRAFHGEAWVSRIGFLAAADHVVDCSHRGFLKPDPAAYGLALETLGEPDPMRVLFVDDQPLNVDGAARAGMATCWFDIADADDSWKRVAELLAT